MYQKLYQEFIEDMQKSSEEEEKINVIARSRLGKSEKSKAAAAAGEELETEEVKYFTIAEQYCEAHTRVISYRLSSIRCLKKGWTILPPPPFEEVRPELLYVISSYPDETLKLQQKSHGFVVRVYPSGKLFLIMFSDGTGQVLYPSGNVAIMITYIHPVQFTYIIMEDKNINPEILAVFKSTGCSTCYHQDGTIWVNLDPVGGFCFAKNGERQKCWTWWDLKEHIHAPPLQPIYLALNSNISVHILSESKVYVTFLHKKCSIRINMGARFVVRDPKVYAEQKPQVINDPLLQSTALKIYTVLDKIQNALKYPTYAHLEKIPPSYPISAQIQKLEKRQKDKRESKE
nr:PREDICTED: glutamate-rich protein 6B [Latimeria chalumnae]|eukprot:XP_014352070.1 PREDICTED: glutamate-rich protein 6B [Latimeria chalumnae]